MLNNMGYSFTIHSQTEDTRRVECKTVKGCLTEFDKWEVPHGDFTIVRSNGDDYGFVVTSYMNRTGNVVNDTSCSCIPDPSLGCEAERCPDGNSRSVTCDTSSELLTFGDLTDSKKCTDTTPPPLHK